MKKNTYIILFLLLSVVSYSLDMNKKALYNQMGLASKINYKVFSEAITGYEVIPEKIQDIVVIIDYTKPSTSKRFYVLDLKNKKIIHESLVSHAKNSGIIDALVFSNTANSYQSSIGFFLTGEVYYGDFGHSLRLKGLEPEINSNAEFRNIVIHGADYVSADYINKNGFLGRTLGCPALPIKDVFSIIETIKDGVVIFIAGNDQDYLKNTKILR